MKNHINSNSTKSVPYFSKQTHKCMLDLDAEKTFPILLKRYELPHAWHVPFTYNYDATLQNIKNQSPPPSQIGLTQSCWSFVTQI